MNKNQIARIETGTDLQLNTDESAILANLERIEDILANVTTDAERVWVRDNAKAVGAAAVHLKLIRIQVKASVLVMRAERAIAKANPVMPNSEVGKLRSDIKHKKLKGYVRFRDREREDGLTYANLRHIQNAYHHFSDTEIEAEVQNAIETDTPLTRKYFIDKAREEGLTDTRRNNSKKAWQSTKTGNPERYTNPAIIERVHAVFGQVPDLDPFSCAEANTVVKAKKIYTQADDGLSQKWHGKTFVSPPFDSETITAAVEKCVDAYFKGHVTEAILLTESLSQPNWYMHAKIACDVEFIHTKNGGRFTYWTPEGKAHKGMSRGYLFYFGDTPTKFAESFSDIGKCYIQYKR